MRPIKKVQNHKIVTKWARKNSFFNFFTPPKLSGSSEDIHYLKRRELLEAHFQLGLFFKEQVIPKAYLFFTRAGYDSDMKSAGSKVTLKKPTRLQATSGPKTPNRKSSAEDKSILNSNEKKKMKEVEKVNITLSEKEQTDKESKPLKNGHIKHNEDDCDNVVQAHDARKANVQHNVPGRIGQLVLDVRVRPLVVIS